MKNLSRTPILTMIACLSLMGTLVASESGGLSSQSESRILTLQEAVRMTLAHSPEVLIAQAQAIRAADATRESRALNLPRLFTGTGLAYNNGFPLSIEGAAPSIFQVSASQPVFSKKNNNLIREAEESGKAGRLGIESARNELAAKTASVYYELHQMRKIVALASAQLGSAQKQQKYTEDLLEAGKVLPVEASIVKQASRNARQQLLVAEEQASIAEGELRELAGLPDSTGIKTVEPNVDSPVFELQEEALYQRAVASSPEMLKAESEVRAKDFHVEAEKGEYLPKMEIVGQYALFSRSNNYADYFSRFERNNFLLGLSIQIPIFNAGIGPRVAQSKQEASEARYRLQNLKSDMKVNIQRGLGTMRIARGAVEVARNDVETARETLQVNETLLEAGRISEKDLENSRAQLMQKELALLEADRTLFQRKLDLLQSAGSLAAAIQ